MLRRFLPLLLPGALLVQCAPARPVTSIPLPEKARIQKAAEPEDQISMMDLRASDIRAELEKITLETLTPIEAMNELYRLKKMLD